MRKKLTFLFLCMLTIAVMAGCGSDDDKKASGRTVDVTITAKNFTFDQKEIVVKKGDTVNLTLKSEDGAHGIRIWGYDVRQDGDGTVTFMADEAGTFKFDCSVQCGTGHSDMTGELIVEE